MPQFAYDAFISYQRDDERIVHRLCEALGQAGLKVWWDSQIRPGAAFADEIATELAQSRRTLVCVTPNAIRSDFVMAEVKHSFGKIIPVLLANTDLSLTWDAAIGKLQHVNLIGAAHFPSSQQFQRLCAELLGKPLPSGMLPEDTLTTQADRLLTNLNDVRDLSLLLALCLLGGAPQDDIGGVAQDLERRFRGVINEPPPSLATQMRSLQSRLTAIGAVSYNIVDPRTQVSFPCARFAEPAMGHAVLAAAWQNLDWIRPPIVSWSAEWAADAPHWIRMRLALHLGVLAQNQHAFSSVWRGLLQPMLQASKSGSGRNAKRFDVADAALSFAAIAPNLKASIEQLLNDMIADTELEAGRSGRQSLTTAKQPAAGTPAAPAASSPTPTTPAAGDTPNLGATPAVAQAPQSPTAPQSPPASSSSLLYGIGTDRTEPLPTGLFGDGTKASQVHTVARLACGYTGARYPDLAVKALRRLADRNQYKALLDVLATCFSELMAGHASEQGLWDPVGILRELLVWVHDVPRGDQQAMPLSIYLMAVGDLPLTSPIDGGTSLASILSSDRGTDAIAQGFLTGLALQDTREHFEDALRHWRDEALKQQKHGTAPATPDPVLSLVTCLVFNAPSERDRARVLHLFRGRYTQADLDAHVLAEPKYGLRT